MNRITPAYAGKRAQQPYIFRHRQDHPRLCGEKLIRDIVFQYPQGSPPPMRGKEQIAVQYAQDVGITPAYAGKSRIDLCSGDLV